MSADKSFLTFPYVRNLPILSWLLQHAGEIEVSFQAHGRNLPLNETELREIIEDDEKEEVILDTPDKRRKINQSANIPRDLSGYRVENGAVRNLNQKVESMVDTSAIYDKRDGVALWSFFSQNGYILLRRLLNRDDVLTANQSIKCQLRKIELMDGDGVATSKVGWTVDRGDGTVIVGKEIYSRDGDISPATAESLKGLAQGKHIEVVA
jgi:hypothetical protein